MKMHDFEGLPIDATGNDLKRWTKLDIFQAARRSFDEQKRLADNEERRASRFAQDERDERERRKVETGRLAAMEIRANERAGGVSQLEDDLRLRNEQITYLKGVIEGLRGATKVADTELRQSIRAFR